MIPIAKPSSTTFIGAFAGMALLGFVFTALVFGPLLARGGVPGDLGDARFNTFVLEHVYRYVSGQGVAFASPGIFYPFPDTLFFSDTHVGTAIVYIVLRTLGLNDLQAFCGWFLIGYATTYAAAHYAFGKFGLKLLPAIVGAAIFAFCLPSLAQSGHAQLVYRCGIPLAMLYLWRFLRETSGADVLTALIWLLLQMLISVYLGVFLAMLMASFVAADLLLEGRAGRAAWRAAVLSDFRRRVASLGAGDIARALIFTVVFIATAALLVAYSHVAHLYDLHHSLGTISIGLPRIASYFIMDELPYWHRFASFVGEVPIRQEHQLFIGLGVLGLLCAGVWRLRLAEMTPELGVLARVMLATLAILFVATLDVGATFALFSKISLYSLVAWLPGLDAIRAVSRIILAMMFPVAFLAASGFAMLVGETKPRLLGIAFGIGLALLAAFEIGSMEKPGFAMADAEQRIGEVARQAKVEGAGIAQPILVLPLPLRVGDPPFVTQLDAMLAAQRLGWATVNGYSGNSVPGISSTPGCDMAEVQYRSFAAWQSRRGKVVQESQDALLRRTVVVNGAACKTKPAD
jgi:hypothetical protein